MGIALLHSFNQPRRRSRLYSFFNFYQLCRFKYQLLNMVNIKYNINRQDFKIVDLNFVKSHSLEIVDRVSETQLQVDENFN